MHITKTSFLLIVLLVFSFCSNVIAKDFTACAQWLKDKGYDSYVTMDKDGNIKPGSDSKAKFNQKENGKTTTIIKDIEEGERFEIIFSKDGEKFQMQTAKTSYRNSYQQQQYAQQMYNPYQFNPNQDNIPVTQQFQKTKHFLGGNFTTINFAFKDGTCFPKEIFSTYMPSQEGGMGIPQSFKSETTTQKCRNLHDFFTKHPGLLSCGNKNVYAKLDQIIYATGKVNIDEKSPFTLTKEFIQKLDDTNRSLSIAEMELRKCDNEKLAPFVKNDKLWEEKRTDHATTEVPVAKK